MQTPLWPNLERRAVADVAADGRRLFGHAVVFDTLSADLGGFRETIAPSAVDRTLVEEIDTRALWNHDPAAVLGRRSSQTLRLLKDAHGLRVEIDVPRTALGNDVLELVKRGDVSGMSFAFSVVPDGERWDAAAGSRCASSPTCGCRRCRSSASRATSRRMSRSHSGRSSRLRQ